MRISDWSSDVCSSDLPGKALEAALELARIVAANGPLAVQTAKKIVTESRDWRQADMFDLQRPRVAHIFVSADAKERSEEHTSELQSLMRISYAVFCLKKKKTPFTNPLRHNELIYDPA